MSTTSLPFKACMGFRAGKTCIWIQDPSNTSYKILRQGTHLSLRLYLFICKKTELAHYHPIRGLPRWLSDKESTCQWRIHSRWGFYPWVGKIPWSRKWQPTPVFLPGKFQEQRSLEGYSIWGRKESDTTEHTCTHLKHLIRLWSRL